MTSVEIVGDRYYGQAIHRNAAITLRGFPIDDLAVRRPADLTVLD